MNTVQASADDQRDTPLYTLSTAARHLGVPARTLRQWVVGRSFSRRSPTAPAKPLIRAPSRSGLISFNNLVEAHVLRAFRSRDGSRMAAAGVAIADAEKALGVERLLLREEMCTSGQDTVLERLNDLIDPSASVRLAMRRMLSLSLERIERDDDGLPVRLCPFGPVGSPDTRTIVLDPQIAFGRPTVAGSRVATATLVACLDAGDRPDGIAAEYGIEADQVVDAAIYERAR